MTDRTSHVRDMLARLADERRVMGDDQGALWLAELHEAFWKRDAGPKDVPGPLHWPMPRRTEGRN
jgi:myo-inositol-hexaphosphate 3-phosphohydrolase